MGIILIDPIFKQGKRALCDANFSFLLIKQLFDFLKKVNIYLDGEPFQMVTFGRSRVVIIILVD